MGNKLWTVSAQSNVTADDLAAFTRIQGRLDNKVNNIVSNLDPVALDSLTEIVAEFQQSDSDLNALIQNLGTTKAEKSAVDALIATVTKASQSDLSCQRASSRTSSSVQWT